MAPKGANVFAPPPSNGTTSPQRASRWQASGKDSDEKSGGRSSTRPSSGKTRSNGDRAKSSKGGKDKDEKESPPQHDHITWYGEPGHDPLGPGGMLHAHVSKGVVRSGMSNPPHNPEVRQALLETLNKWEVRPHPKPKKQEEKKESQSLRPVISLQPPSMGHTDSDSSHMLKSAGGMVAGTHGKSFSSSAPALGSGGSTSSNSRLQSPVPAQKARVGSASSTYRSSMRGTATKPKSKNSNKAAWEQFELELTQEGKMKKPSLDTAPEGEVKWKSFRLKKNAREHGYLLDQFHLDDLCKLGVYHNGVTRSMHGTTSSTVSSGFPARSSTSSFPTVHHSRQVNNMRSDLHCSIQDAGGYFREDDAIPIHRKQAFQIELDRELGKTLPMPPPRPPPEEAPSADRYMELGGTVLRAGPYRLQAMAHHANISVLSATKPPEPVKLPLAEQTADAYDPLFGSPNTTPRSTHSGKPLPVPHWGRNGERPVLRH